MDKFMQDFSVIWGNPRYFEEFTQGMIDTVYSTLISTVVAFLFGMVLAVLLVIGEKDGVRPLPGPLMKILNVIINVFRSVPFLILMLFVLPLSVIVVGTRIGTPASIIPLIVAAAPFIARLVETSLREVDKGVIEAAQAMGCSPFQIVWKVMLPEALPSLISSFTTALITILGYGAMAGAIGGGGLGKIAINYGYNKYNYAVMLVATVLIVILVQIAQSIGTYLAARLDKRNTDSISQRRRAAKKAVKKDRKIPGAM